MLASFLGGEKGLRSWLVGTGSGMCPVREGGCGARGKGGKGGRGGELIKMCISTCHI